MKNSLKTLTRIQKFNIDEQRKLLTEQLTREEELIKALADLNWQFEQEKEFSRSHSGLGDFGLYVKKYMAARDDLETRINAVRQKIAAIREVIADLFKEQKTYEIVDDNRRRAAQKEIDAKEQKMLDEIGTNTYIKRKQ